MVMVSDLASKVKTMTVPGMAPDGSATAEVKGPVMGSEPVYRVVMVVYGPEEVNVAAGSGSSSLGLPIVDVVKSVVVDITVEENDAGWSGVSIATVPSTIPLGVATVLVIGSLIDSEPV
jgi:hypothetical protein